MAKLTLNDITSGYASVDILNNNFTAIETALENTLSRDGTTPNSMSADLDMNGYRILNELASTGEGFVWEGAWVTATEYQINNLVQNNGNTYICISTHTSSVFATDLSANKWELLVAKGLDGSGGGNVYTANNLSEFTATATTARGNIGAAKSGANSDITSLSALSTALSVSQGGTGQTTLSATTQSLLDTISTTQGTVLYNNGTDWVALGTGTSGYFLQTRGAGTNPQWAVGSPTLLAAQTPTVTTSVDFLSIPVGVKRITLLFSQVSTNGAGGLLVQIGDSGGLENSGYEGGAQIVQEATGFSGLYSTAGFPINSSLAANSVSGSVTITNLDGNIWVASGVFRPSSIQTGYVAGTKTLTGTLDRVSLITLNGVDTFDALGKVNVLYE